MRPILTAALCLCFVPAVLVAGEDNPFKTAKVGDWAEYKMTGPNVEGKTKMTIVAKDDKEVTYEVAGSFSFMGKEMTAPVQKMKVDLTKSYDPITAANLMRTGTKIEKDGEGKEKIKVGEKQHDTKWTKLKATTTVMNMTIVSETKMWYSKDVPVTGLLKMETSTGTTMTKLELVGSGRK